MRSDEELAARLVQAIGAADQVGIANCFQSDARLRALTPPGPKEAQGADAAGELIAGWFRDADPLDNVYHHVDRVGDRLHLEYMFEGTEGGDDFVVQQQVYATVADGRLEDATLLCSGFRPRVG